MCLDTDNIIISWNYDLLRQPLDHITRTLHYISFSLLLCYNVLDFSPDDDDPSHSLFCRFVLSDLIFNQRRPIWSRAERFANYHRDPFHFAKSKP